MSDAIVITFIALALALFGTAMVQFISGLAEVARVIRGRGQAFGGGMLMASVGIAMVDGFWIMASKVGAVSGSPLAIVGLAAVILGTNLFVRATIADAAQLVARARCSSRG